MKKNNGEKKLIEKNWSRLYRDLGKRDFSQALFKGAVLK